MSAGSREKILLSVITPVTLMAGRLQNLSAWLKEINSKPIEVFLIHDWNDAKTSQELNTLVKKLGNLNVNLIEGSYGSPGAARNAGLQLIHGEWFCFWDSDDLPQISEVMKLLESSIDLNVDCLATNYLSINESSGAKKLHFLSTNHTFEIAVDPGIWRHYFRKTSFPSTKFSNLRMAEDQLYLTENLTNKKKLEVRPNFTYHYIEGGKFSLTGNTEALNDLAKACKQTLEVMQTGNYINLEFAGIMFSRQLFSSVKYGDLKCKTQAIYCLFIALLRSPYRIKKCILLGLKKLIYRELTYD